MNEIDKIITQSEKILWQDRPQFLPFVLKGLAPLVFGSLFMAVGIFAAFTAGKFDPSFLLFIILGFLIGPGSFIYNFLNYRFVHYTMTDKRTIIQRGVIGRDFITIEHDQITSSQVEVGLWDKIFGKNSGSISIIHAGSRVGKHGPRPSYLRSITDPYQVFKFFNQVSHDVRADIQYPNAMRPAENQGYKTDYQNKV